ncbi:MAG: hypothetical protein LBH32_07170 [Dysgonamonadaceae bacterium]|jgi:arginine repressor|nr:hypothetical protein [Dysgonamonadaceae bacterium]
MPHNDISVTDATICRDFIGRDDNSLNINNSYERSVYLQNLYDKFQEEKSGNQELREFCEELDYLNSVIDNEVIGLEQKLKDGHREYLIDYAKDVKERFHKKLIQTSQYSNVAQDINIYLLTKVRRGFMMEIYKLICDNEPQDKINLLITKRIINPVKADLGINLFRYNEDDIMGMIFFLTGNCHIKWSN